MLNKLYQYAHNHMMSSETPITIRISNLVYACVIVACFMGAIVTRIIGSPLSTVAVIFASAMIMFLLTVYFNKTGRLRTGTAVMFAIGSNIFLPISFFLTGGMQGGLTNFSVLCIAVAFILFNFWECVVMIAANMATLLVCILVNYYHPELVKPLNHWQQYVSRASTIVICGLAIGLIIKFQKKVYSEKKQKAEDAVRTKTRFLATISHEIRTPLNAIIGLTELEMSQKLPADTLDNLYKVHASGNTLLNIINDVLDSAKIESGRLFLNIAPYDVPILISDTVNLNLVRIGSKTISFEISIDENIPLQLMGDEIRIKQILNNLLSNAFKFTNEGSIKMSVGHHEDENGFWLDFSVSDTGTGIKEENLKNLFKEIGESSESIWRKAEGTGLGLVICKNLVEMMKGCISVDSVYGSGSTFTFHICQEVFDPTPIGFDLAEDLKNFRFSPGIHRINEKPQVSYMPDARVLVVDDVITNLEVAKGMMLRYGMKVDLATSAKEAVEIIRDGHCRYDAIFMDHMMPGMDGIEAVRIIRKDIKTAYAANVPIIALTANALTGNEKLFLENGFQAFLSKPIDAMQLDMVLNKWLRKAQDPDQVRPGEYAQGLTSVNSTQSSFDLLIKSSIAGLDIIAGLQHFDNNPDAYLLVLKSYLTHIPELLEKTRTVTRDNLRDYAITVHGIKGSSYSISAYLVGKLALMLEKAAKEGNYDEVVAKNEIFITKTYDLIADISDLLQTITADKSEDKKLRNSPDKGQLSKLLEASLHYDLKSMESVMCTLERNDYRDDQGLIVWLRQKLNDLEYDSIAEKLSALGLSVEEPLARDACTL